MNPRQMPVLDIDMPAPVCVNNLEAVPIALILNELIFNAIKHVASSDVAAGVTVALRFSGNTARVSIRNRGVASAGVVRFCDRPQPGYRLAVVKSLLPHDGACLDISDGADGVKAELLLRPPVIIPSDNASHATQ